MSQRVTAGSAAANAAVAAMRRAGKPGRRERPEHKIQRELVRKLRRLLQGCLINHADAGAASMSQIRRKKELGAFATYPDVLIHLPDGVDLLIEVKEPGQTPTAGQRETMRWLNATGRPATWCTSADQGIRWVKKQTGLDSRPRPDLTNPSSCMSIRSSVEEAPRGRSRPQPPIRLPLA